MSDKSLVTVSGRGRPLNPSTARSKRTGFSLVEVMIGILIIAIMGLAVVGNAVLNMKMAHATVLKNTAYSTAQSFLEQIRAMDIPVIQDAIDNPRTSPLPTLSVSALAVEEGKDYFIEDPLYVDDPHAVAANRQNYKKILIDLKETKSGSKAKPIEMEMWIDLNITRLTQGSGYLIEIIFQYSAMGTSNAFLSKDPIRIATIRSDNSGK